eukprot:TRINITY_DN13997_c0_g1_i1.p2 TRINITY_DN13997_c0_g1~~TRINITY_DN13997_c0_g1_i1.p2  ORF type:complete len:110 (-),score=6.76 TRINITY_DN13997_c0_g1_i1:50-379(-)
MRHADARQWTRGVGGAGGGRVGHHHVFLRCTPLPLGATVFATARRAPVLCTPAPRTRKSCLLDADEEYKMETQDPSRRHARPAGRPFGKVTFTAAGAHDRLVIARRRCR